MNIIGGDWIKIPQLNIFQIKSSHEKYVTKMINSK